MSTITKNDKLISLRMPTGIIDFAKRNAKKQGRTMSNYLRWLVIEQMDTTEYLLSSPANAAMLNKSIEQLNSSKAKMITKTIEELEAMETLPISA
jgi:predicted DNA-binding protein